MDDITGKAGAVTPPGNPVIQGDRFGWSVYRMSGLRVKAGKLWESRPGALRRRSGGIPAEDVATPGPGPHNNSKTQPYRDEKYDPGQVYAFFGSMDRFEGDVPGWSGDKQGPPCYIVGGGRVFWWGSLADSPTLEFGDSHSSRVKTIGELSVAYGERRKNSFDQSRQSRRVREQARSRGPSSGPGRAAGLHRPEPPVRNQSRRRYGRL